MDVVFLVMALCASLLLTSCSYVDVPRHSKSVALIKKHSEIKITDIYQRFTPTLDQFRSLQKRHISKEQYEQYLKLLQLKSQSLNQKFQDAFLSDPALIYKSNIHERKRNARKEWVWVNDKLINQYYKSFHAPVYEHKIIYQILPSPKAKTETNSALVFYFYKKEGVNKIYLIDPDIYKQSVLLK